MISQFVQKCILKAASFMAENKTFRLIQHNTENYYGLHSKIKSILPYFHYIFEICVSE